MISLSERLRPNLRSKYRVRPKLNFGLSPDFSIQLKVSPSERLNQKLKSPIVIILDQLYRWMGLTLGPWSLFVYWDLTAF